jgi:hypothetical protein
MAEIAPWLQPAPESNLAPWLNKESEVGAVEDSLRAIPSGLAKGAIAVAGTPGDLQGLAKLADDKGYNPIKWLFDKASETKLGKFLKESSAETLAKNPGLANSGDMMGGGNIELPTSAGIKKTVEDNVTGKLYDAKTAPGRAVQTAFEVAPALATGPVGGLRGLAVKSAGAGVGSELAGQGAAATKHLLPEAAQPWAEPVARAAGTLPGMMLPTAARKVVTPLPMSDEQFRTVQALRQTNPELVQASTAGQLTERPRLMSMESRSPLGKGAEAAQEQAFTTGAMRQAGIDGDFSQINQGRAIGEEIGNIRRGGNIDSTNFQPMLRDAKNERRNLQRTAGKGRSPQADEAVQQLEFGAMNNGQPVMSMPGARYNYMRGELERLASATNNPEERLAIGRMRDRMDEAFRAGMPADLAATLAARENQYANYNVLANIVPAPGKTTVTPKEVKAAVGHSWGNKAANEGRGTLAPLADDASRVMTPHPTPPAGDKIPPSMDLLITALSSAAGGGAGHALGGGIAHGLESGVLGHLVAPSIYHGTANAASRAVSSAPAQTYLGNQRWRPGAATTTDMDQLVRLLMSPESRPQ